MANSLIMLTCKHCGKQICIGKGYYGSYGTVSKTTEKLNNFFHEHEYGTCTGNICEENRFSDDAKDHFVILEEGDELEDLKKFSEESE